MIKPKRKPKKEKESEPNFVLTLKLDTEKYQEDILDKRLDKRLDIGRRIYNACLNELCKRYARQRILTSLILTFMIILARDFWVLARIIQKEKAEESHSN